MDTDEHGFRGLDYELVSPVFGATAWKSNPVMSKPGFGPIHAPPSPSPQPSPSGRGRNVERAGDTHQPVIDHERANAVPSPGAEGQGEGGIGGQLHG